MKNNDLRLFELGFCIAGIYICFLSWGVLQERVTTTPYYSRDEPNSPKYFKYYVFMNMMQSFCACIAAFLYLIYIRKSKFAWPSSALLNQYAKVAFLGSIASPFGYESLKHVNYLTMILAKSCKLLPVILMSFLLYRKVFQWYKYASVALITLGVTMFTLWNSKSVKSDDSAQFSAGRRAYGLFLLSINLMIDGITNSSQDYIFKAYHVNGSQMMFFMNFFSTIYMVFFLAFLTPFLNADNSSDLLEASNFLMQYPKCLLDVASFGLLGSLGQLFIFYTLENFGSLVLVTVNVTRKMLSMLLSVFWFGHRLGYGQWLSVGLVFGGIGLEARMSGKNAKSNAKKEDSSKNVPAEERVDLKANGSQNTASKRNITSITSRSKIK